MSESDEGRAPSIYDQEFSIGLKHVDDPHFIRAMYSRYIFDKLLHTDRSTSAGGAFEMASAEIFSNYFLSDFSNAAPPKLTAGMADKWVGILWDIRRKHGNQFVGKSLFYALQRWGYPLDDPDKEDFDRFFGLRLANGVHIEDNNMENQESISSILRMHGVQFP